MGSRGSCTAVVHRVYLDIYKSLVHPKEGAALHRNSPPSRFDFEGSRTHTATEMTALQDSFPANPHNQAEEVADVSRTMTLNSESNGCRCTDHSQLLDAVKALIIPFIQSGSVPISPSSSPVPATPANADHAQVANGSAASKAANGNVNGATKAPRGVVQAFPPEELRSLLNLDTPEQGLGREGLLDLVAKTLDYSVNTWDQGFMDKLYASTNAVSGGGAVMCVVFFEGWSARTG